MSFNSPLKSTLNITVLSKNADALVSQITQFWDQSSMLKFDAISTTAADIDPAKVTVLLADPNLAASIIPHCTSLDWCQSTWAGNAPLLQLNKTDYQLTGIKDVFGKLMREYVFAYLLYYARNIPEFSRNQAQQPPQWIESPRFPLMGKTLGILGAGSIAKALVPVAASFDMNIVGLSRSGDAVDGFDQMYTPNTLIDFARRVDHVVNLMPDTPETTGMLNECFFSELTPESLFINVGRGNAIVEQALLHALDKGHLKAAILDVFQTEPLPEHHPFWHHPKIVVTAHTAAVSYPQDVAKVFVTNAKRYIANKPLLHVLDFNRGY